MPLELLYCFAFFLLLCLSAVGYGLCVLSWGRLTPSDSRLHIAYASGLGCGVIAYLILFIGIVQLLYPASAYVVLIFGLKALFFKRREFKDGMGALFKDITAIVSPLSPAKWVWLCFIVAFIFLNLSIALTPPVSKDALIYHILGPSIFIQNRGIGFISDNFYTNFPFTTEMLFTMGMLLKGPILAKLIHFWFGVLTLLVIFQWTATNTSVSTGLFAGTIYYTLPLVAQLSGWAYVDLSLAFFILAMIMALLDCKERQHRGFIVVSGLFAGLAMGTKYSGVPMVLIVILGAVLLLNRKNESADIGGTKALWILFIAAVVALPWYLKSWILTGNPTYPFLYALFGGRGWSHEMGEMYALFLSYIGSGPGIADYLKLPWDICFLGGNGRPDFDGYIGPVFLVVPVLAVVVRPKSDSLRLMLFFAAVYFFLWGLLIQQLRLLLPIFPILSIVLAVLIYRMPPAWSATKFCIITFCLVTVAINTYFHVGYVRGVSPLKYLIGAESEAAFLRTRLPSYPAVEYVNQHLTQHDKVLFVFVIDGPYYCKIPYVYNPVFEANTFMDVIRASSSARDALARFRQAGITHILFNHNYVMSVASILEEKYREPYFRLMGLLSTETCFQDYRLYKVNLLVGDFR